MRHVDVAIVGAGTAGLGAFREVRRYTQSFVIINDGPWGTLCARAGCMPSKALIEAANAYHRRKDLAKFGIAGSESLTVDIGAVLARVREIRDQLVADVCELTNGLGERAIEGRARLLGPDRLTVDGQEISAGRIILATGSHPRVPDAWRALSGRLLTTDTLFEQSSLPKRIAVLGLGPVGVEMAQALARLGCEVTAFGNKETVAGLRDPVINAAMIEALREDLVVHVGHEVDVRAEGNAVRVLGGDVSVLVDCVLVALGRQPNLKGLGLETLGLRLDEHGKPEVDPTTLQVGHLPVFLAGDAEGDRPLLHEASDEGHIAGRNARGEVIAHRRRVPLTIVFTSPNVAIVGRPYSELEALPLAIGEADLRQQGRARLGLRAGGHLRIYADPAHGALLGAEIAAPDGEHLGHFLALAMERGCTAQELLRAPFYHPCLEEALREALRGITKTVNGEGAFELG